MKSFSSELDSQLSVGMANKKMVRVKSNLGKRKINKNSRLDISHKKPKSTNGSKSKFYLSPPVLDEVDVGETESGDESDTSMGKEEVDRSVQRANRLQLKQRLQRTLFVGNLPVGVTQKQLQRLIDAALKHDLQSAESGCSVESVRFRGVVPPTGGTGKLSRKRAVIHADFSGGVSKTLIAYVVLTSKVGMQAALKLNGHWLEPKCPTKPIISSEQTDPITSTTTSTGTHIRVDRAACQNKGKSRHHATKCVFLGNLPFDVNEEEVRNVLAEFGEINNIRLIRDRDTGAVKGIGFVEFADIASISLAIRSSGTLSIRHRTIRIQEYNPKFHSVSTDKKPRRTVDTEQDSIAHKETKKHKSTKLVGRKLDHKGQTKGITLPSNLRGLQREAYLQKRLLKKQKRQRRRQAQTGQPPVKKPRTKNNH